MISLSLDRIEIRPRSASEVMNESTRGVPWAKYIHSRSINNADVRATSCARGTDHLTYGQFQKADKEFAGGELCAECPGIWLKAPLWQVAEFDILRKRKYIESNSVPISKRGR